MNKVVSRLLIFFVGIPAIICLVCLKSYNHLALHIALCLVSCIAANELYSIFAAKNPQMPKPLIICCTVFIPLVASLQSVLPAFTGVPFLGGQEIITYSFIISFLIILTYEVFTAKSFESSNVRLSQSFFIVMYAGYLITFISRMTTFKKTIANTESVLIEQDVSIQFISVFLLMVFICDSFAWLFGMLFGKNNRGVVKASPNKSIAGFIGGIAGSIIAGLLAYFIWPQIFNGSIIKIIIVGLVIAFSAIIGDLVESIFKRSSEFKDSGHIIPGRGGILDSIDSILMSSPIFYLLVSILYGPLA